MAENVWLCLAEVHTGRIRRIFCHEAENKLFVCRLGALVDVFVYSLCLPFVDCLGCSQTACLSWELAAFGQN